MQWRVARRRYASALPHCKFIVLTLSVAAWCVCACPAAVPCLRYLPICLPTRPPSALICASFLCLSIFPPACHPPVCLPVLACPRMVLLMALLRGRTSVRLSVSKPVPPVRPTNRSPLRPPVRMSTRPIVQLSVCPVVHPSTCLLSGCSDGDG